MLTPFFQNVDSSLAEVASSLVHQLSRRALFTAFTVNAKRQANVYTANSFPIPSRCYHSSLEHTPRASTATSAASTARVGLGSLCSQNAQLSRHALSFFLHFILHLYAGLVGSRRRDILGRSSLAACLGARLKSQLALLRVCERGQIGVEKSGNKRGKTENRAWTRTQKRSPKAIQ